MMVDAKGLVAGRLSTKLAKSLINGETITVVNAEEAVIVGAQASILKKYKQRVDAQVKSNPHYGPKYERIPSKILRKMVKGMLPNKSRTAERLIKNIKVYNSVPASMEKEKFEEITGAKCNEKHDFLTLGTLAHLLGGKW